jgi:hypothetical protein
MSITARVPTLSTILVTSSVPMLSNSVELMICWQAIPHFW